jgi:uncharacterized protein YdaU (DUF1376 family)
MESSVTRPPYRAQYVGDLLAETALWSGPEAALLEWLRALQFAGGPLPLDSAELAKCCRYPLKEFRRLWIHVSSAFVETPEGWVCPRTRESHEHAVELSRARARAGRAGGLAEKQKRSNREAVASVGATARAKQLPDKSVQVNSGDSLRSSSSGFETSVQSVGGDAPTVDSERTSHESDFPTQMTTEAEAIIQAARPEGFPAEIFRKWCARNEERAPPDWRGSLRRFASMERFDSRQWEQQKAATRESDITSVREVLRRAGAQ